MGAPRGPAPAWSVRGERQDVEEAQAAKAGHEASRALDEEPVVLGVGGAHGEGAVVRLDRLLVADGGALVVRGEDPAAGALNLVGNALELAEDVLPGLGDGGVGGRAVRGENVGAVLDGLALSGANLRRKRDEGGSVAKVGERVRGRGDSPSTGQRPERRGCTACPRWRARSRRSSQARRGPPRWLRARRRRSGVRTRHFCGGRRERGKERSFASAPINSHTVNTMIPQQVAMFALFVRSFVRSFGWRGRGGQSSSSSWLVGLSLSASSRALE